MPGLYIHIPFCHKRCVYCDFYLVTNLELINNFLSSLKKEISISSAIYKSENFDSIYLGGGTPSILSLEQVSGLIKDLHDNFTIAGNAEITIEANPEDLRNIDLLELKAAGVNRLSIGVQSFKDDELKFLTREHTGEEAVELLQKVNGVFDNYSVDLIYSLPGQNEKDVMESIRILDRLNVPHVSAYALTYEERTPLYKMVQRGDIAKNTGEKESDLFEYVSDNLTALGYRHYEISSFTRPGYEAVHNSKYWKYENYLGLGPSAHSFFHNRRWNNLRSVKEYGLKLDKGEFAHENKSELTPGERKFEFIMTALRSEGISLDRYYALFGEDFIAENNESIEFLKKSGHAQLSQNRFSLTRKGFLLADEITAKYF